MSRQRDAEAGFTLIELTVTLAVIAMVLAVAYPRFTTQKTVSVESVARDIVRSLRRERTEAMANGESRVVTVSKFLAGLPGDMVIAVDSSAAASLGAGALVFHPNGASSGARWQVSNGDRNVAIDIDWLTGKVSIDAP